jgi:hypothetical protein
VKGRKGEEEKKRNSINEQKSGGFQAPAGRNICCTYFLILASFF